MRKELKTFSLSGSRPQEAISKLFVLVALQILLLTPSAWSGQSLIDATNAKHMHVVVFAAKQIPVGERLSRSALHQSIINSKNMKEDELPSLRSLLGRRLKYEIAPGQIIMEHDLVPRYVAKSKERLRTSTFIRAKLNLPRGTIISRDHLETGSIQVSDSSHWIRDFRDAIGSKAATNIIKGEILTTDVLAR